MTERLDDPALSMVRTSSFLGSSIRIGIAGLLLLTALLKAASPAAAVGAAAAYGLSYDFVILVVMLELAMATWLASGWRPRLAIGVAAVLFCVFAGYSLVLTLSGVSSCGCFGSLPVSPSITFALDLVVIGLLGTAWRLTNSAAPLSPGRYLVVGVAHLGVSAAALALMMANRPTTLAANQAVQPNAELIVLEPETWAGERLPIAPYLQPKVDFDEGRWTLLLYHHDCPDCQAVLPSYEQLANAPDAGSDHRVGLVETPPYGPQVDRGRATLLRLSDNIEWFVQAPVEVIVEGGVVTNVSRDNLMVGRRRAAAPKP